LDEEVTMSGSRIDRRAFLARGGASVGVLVLPSLLAACGGSSSSASGGKQLTVVSFGGDYQKAQYEAYWKPYLAANRGIELRQDSPNDNAKIRAMVEAHNVTWDLVCLDDSFGTREHARWLEPIDYGVIDRTQFLDGYTDTYRLGSDIEATVLAYRPDKLPNGAPGGLVDFFDAEKFPGKRSAWKYAPGGILEAALIADGVAPDRLYPLDVDRALKKLDTIRDDLVWWTEGAQSQQMLATGETPLALVWTGRAVDAARDGQPVEVQWSQWMTQNAWWVVPKGAPNKELAMQAIKFVTAPEQQARLTEYLPYGPTNRAAARLVKPQFRDRLPTSHLDGRIVVDAAWWAKNFDAVDKKFQGWLLG
jgi:putative spermidine/putrescine transport system substrate-binding protein